MAVTTTFTVSGTKSGDISPSASGTQGSTTIGTWTVTNANSSMDWTRSTLTTGFNSISIPNASLKGVWYFPPSGNTLALTLKGITGDTGIPLNLTDPGYIPFVPGTSALGLTVASPGGIIIEFLWV